jgi:AcrR family transcriptional regulator
VEQPVNRRRYDAPRRREAADRTRARILAAAGALFRDQGYEPTAVAQIARRAGVSVDTVYAAVGRKPQLVRTVIDDLLGEGRGPVLAEQREYVERIRATEGAAAKLAVYAAALARLHPQVAPLVGALRDAGRGDEECRRAWQELIERRAANMRTFAAELRSTGELRDDLDDAAVGDLVWATNSPEYFLLLASRGWSPERYRDHLGDLWTRLLLS